LQVFSDLLRGSGGEKKQQSREKISGTSDAAQRKVAAAAFFYRDSSSGNTKELNKSKIDILPRDSNLHILFLIHPG
jgi:hypothetical protein